MAVEAEEIEQEATADETAALEEMQSLLDEAPDEELTEETDETEQAEGDDVSAEGDSVDDAPAPAEEAASEGPSFLMKQEAVRAGIDPTLIGRAKSDQDLELMIEAASRRETKEEAPAPEPFALSIELPEDEYGPDDPIRKQLAVWQQQLTKRDEEVSKALQSFAMFANQQLDRVQQEDQRTEIELRTQLYSEFDKELDAYESDALGKTGKLTKEQLESRKAIAEAYQALGATPDTPAAEKRRLAQLAVEARRRDVSEKRKTTQAATVRQQRRVQGGGGNRPVKPGETESSVLAEWDRRLKTGKPLLTE